MSIEKWTPERIRALKGVEPVAALTTYDYPMTQLLDGAGIPLLLVGDSLGMVVLGYPDTTFVTLEEVLHHVRACARAKPKGLLVADMPFRTYDTVEAAVRNARRLIDAGAEAVKAEGGVAIRDQVEAMTAAGIPVLGHVGMLPQSVQEEGGYRIKGKTEPEEAQLHRDGQALTEAGAFGVVLELVAPLAAGRLTKSLPIPTIGIGSGPHCDGQILVTTDLFGTSPGFIPRHVQPRGDLASAMRDLVQAWRNTLASLP
jgi:3-methyl-2-oxobutanoate hydroxymethyltransferase